MNDNLIKDARFSADRLRGRALDLSPETRKLKRISYADLFEELASALEAADAKIAKMESDAEICRQAYDSIREQMPSVRRIDEIIGYLEGRGKK